MPAAYALDLPSLWTAAYASSPSTVSWSLLCASPVGQRLLPQAGEAELRQKLTLRGLAVIGPALAQYDPPSQLPAAPQRDPDPGGPLALTGPALSGGRPRRPRPATRSCPPAQRPDPGRDAHAVG